VAMNGCRVVFVIEKKNLLHMSTSEGEKGNHQPSPSCTLMEMRNIVLTYGPVDDTKFCMSVLGCESPAK
jgi:hypothetical protein